MPARAEEDVLHLCITEDKSKQNDVKTDGISVVEEYRNYLLMDFKIHFV